MPLNTSKSKSGSDHRQHWMKQSPSTNYYNMPSNTRQPLRDFQQHKSNGGVAMATTINEIRTFKQRKGQGQRAKGNQGKICGKCGMSHLPRECPAWGKKCHKCGNKNHFSTQCRSKQSGAGTRKSCSTSRGCKRKGKPHHSRSRSKLVTKSAYSMESASFQDHSDDLHGEKNRWPPWEKEETSMDIREETSMEPTPFKTIQESTDFLKQSFLPFPSWSLWPA